MAFARFMAGPLGRSVRVVAGFALIAIGIVNVASGATALGIILAVVGAVVCTAGVANVCLIAPLLRAPFHGRDARA